MKKILCLTVIVLLLSGCAITDKKNKLAMAAVVGGVAGGFVGFSVFGPGQGDEGGAGMGAYRAQGAPRQVQGPSRPL